jgi:hypothetical protein
MRYRNVRHRDDDGAPCRRLRVPVALAVAFVGSSVAAVAWYGGCGTHPLPDPGPDGGRLSGMVDDAYVVDASDDAQLDVDAGVEPDAGVDGAPADAPPH